ncbi:MAG: hypothetical protein Q7J10_04760 [Methanosarcinaceae archaeon]|nr:hypothetical protein [Methanosarcinaceae archaeon]
MKRKYILFGGFVILLLFSLFLLKSSIPYDLLGRPQEGELNFTLTPEKTHVKEGENFEIELELTNTGDNKINVWDLEEQVSYNIILSYQNATELPYLCGVIERTPLTNEYLVKLNPGESMKHTQDSNCWELSRGEYSLRAVYYTQLGERITKPYWVGSIESEPVTIIVE